MPNFVPVTGDLSVSTTTAPDSSYVSIATLASGKFAATWVNFISRGRFQVLGQMFFPDGSKDGGEIDVSGIIPGAFVSLPKISSLGSGFVITWDHDLSGAQDVLGRTFDATGAATSGIFKIPSVQTASEYANDTATSAGGFMSVWISLTEDSAGFHRSIKGRLFDVGGFPLAGEFVIASETPSVGVSVAALSGGGYIVVWSAGQDDADLLAQAFGADGQPVGGLFAINAAPIDILIDFTAEALPSGGFVVSWTEQNQDGTEVDVRARIFGSAMEALGDVFAVNANSVGIQRSPAISSIGDGRFVIAWAQQGGEESPYTGVDVRAQVFGAGGERLGDAFFVNNNMSTTAQQMPDVTLLNDGSLFFAWHETGPDNSGDFNGSIEGRLFAPEFVTTPNSAPINTIPGPQSGTEDTGLVFSEANGNAIAVSDVDGGLLTVTLSAGNGTLTLASSTGVTVDGDGTATVVLSGSSTDINAALDGLVYRGGLNFEGSDTLSVVTSDGSLEDSDTISIALADDGRINGDGADNTLTGTPQVDIFMLEQGGHDTAYGLGSNDGFYMGGALDALDYLDGGAGENDQLILQGDYAAGLTLGANNLVNTEVLALLAGDNTFFGNPGTNFYFYNLTSVDANVAAGERLVIDATALRVGENFTFNGSAETDGAFTIGGGRGVDTLTGGAGADLFLFHSQGQWGSSDTVDGGGGMDELALRGNYSGLSSVTFGATQLVNVEVLSLLSGRLGRFGHVEGDFNYRITSDDANVAAGKRFVVDAGQLTANESVYFDGSAETDGFFWLAGGAGNDVFIGGVGKDLIIGGVGNDTMYGGAGSDTFVFRSVADSNVNDGRDGIQDFTLGDIIDLSKMDADLTTPGINDAFTFIGTNGFTGHAGELRVEEVNTAAHFWEVSGDTNGDGIADFQVLVVVTDGHALTSGDFLP